MWNSSVKIDYMAGLLADSIENYLVDVDDFSFAKSISELKVLFPNCNDDEIMNIINLCIQLYLSGKTEHTEFVLTVPDSFKVKAQRTRDVLCNLIENTKKSLTITGYSISDYFLNMLDSIIHKSQQGIYIRLYVNDMERQRTVLERLMSYRSRFLQVYEFQRREDDKMAALHAKLLVSDAEKVLVSSANLSYHGIEGNIEMGFLMESVEKAKQIESIMKELIRMKVFVRS